MSIQNNYTGMGVSTAGVFLIGNYFSGGHTQILHKRSLMDGSVLWTNYDDDLFNLNGNPDQNSVRLCVDGTALYVSGNSDSTELGWRVQRRDITNGAIIKNDFSTPGNVKCFPGNIAQNSTGLFVIGFVRRSGPTQLGWRIEKRDKTLLSIIWFKEYLWTNTSWSGYPLDIAADEENVYIVGYEHDSVGGQDEWRIECRTSATGALSWSKPISGSGALRAYAVTVYGDAVYVLGNDPGGSGNLLLKKLKISDGSDYGGSWSDNTIMPVLGSQTRSPASISASALGVFILCAEQDGGATLYHREKINLDMGMRIWASPDANFSNQFSLPKKITALGNYIYLCGPVLGSGVNEAGYVEKCRA